jgi:hypothetical protein
MPPSSYRRRIRTNVPALYNRYITPTAPIEENNFDRVIENQRDIYRVLENIIQLNTFTESTQTLEKMVESVSDVVEYYRILDIIEHNLLSVACNIADCINPEIICARILYIKSIIDTLPPNSAAPGYVSNMIMEVIESVINGVNFDAIRTKLVDVQQYINTNYGNGSLIELIQHNILGLVCNISDGVNSAIICSRVEYIKTLIQQLSTTT